MHCAGHSTRGQWRNPLLNVTPFIPNKYPEFVFWCQHLFLQLNMAKDSETVLEGFQEGPLKFPPTYKFDVGTDTYDTRLVRPGVLLWILGCWLNITVILITHFWEKVLLSLGETQLKCLFFNPPFSHSLCVFDPVGRSVNRLGPTGSSGVLELPRLPTWLRVLGSVAPFQGWPAGLKWRSTITEVTWSILSVTTNPCPLSSPCRWDTPEHIRKMTQGLLLYCTCSFSYHKLKYFMSAVDVNRKTRQNCKFCVQIQVLSRYSSHFSLWIFNENVLSAVPVQSGYSVSHPHCGGRVE